jgi:hypothetical protein
MTDEDFVVGWLKRRTGTDFTARFPRESVRVRELLLDPPLPTVDPSEGVGSCTCKKTKSEGVRFYLSTDEFMGICVACGSWSIMETRAALRRRKGIKDS